MNLQQTIDALIAREGRYSNNPADPGGETMWGITATVARANGYAGSMKDMPRDTATAIYTYQYWTLSRFDEVSKIDPFIAEELLDTGVNMGVATAGRFLQRALNVLLPISLTRDGVIGDMTLTALKSLLDARGVPGRLVLLRMLNAQQSVRYIELAEANPAQETFEYGWQLNRVSS